MRFTYYQRTLINLKSAHDFLKACFVLRTEGLRGTIMMNDSERDLSQFRKLSAYIMQDNQLHANLTVDEAMNVAAKLKIGEKKRIDREDIVR